MSGINFLSDNLTDNATLSLTSGTANAQFPLNNLLDDTTTRKFRTTGNTAVIQIDLLTTRDIDTIAVVGDSTGSLGITSMSVKTSVTTDFSLSVANAITLSSVHNMGYEFITAVTHRFVQITVTGTGSYVEISKLFIGERTNLANNSLSIGSFKYKHTDRSSFRRNEYGQKFIDVRNKTKVLSGALENCDVTEQETIDDMYIDHGETKPLWMIVDPNSDAMNVGNFKLSIYGYFNRMPDWSSVGGQLYNTNLSLEQVV